MLHKLKLLFIGSLITGSLFAQEVITSQGDYFVNGTGSLSFTIGEPITEMFSATNNDLTQGFQQVTLIATLVKDITKDVNVQVFPNPVTNFLTINVGDLEGQSSFLLFDNQGKLIKKEIITNNSSVVDFTSYAKGIYFLNLQNKDNQLIKTYKIVRQ